MTVTTVMDRIHAINGTISGVKVKRTFPQNLTDSAIYPFLVPMVGRVVAKPTMSATFAQVTREYPLLLVVEAWMAGLPTESASLQVEALVQVINMAYYARPRLELDGNTPLATVKQLDVMPDSGVTALAEGVNVAVVRFPLHVTTLETVTLEMTTP